MEMRHAGSVEPVRRRAEHEKAQGAAVFFTQDTHVPDDREFDMFPPHCIEGSGEELVIDELADLAAEAVAVKKRRYSAFFETDLAHRLAVLAPEEVIVMGDCTDICVLHTTADARNRDYGVEVPGDCVASFDSDAHAWAVGHLQNILGAKVV